MKKSFFINEFSAEAQMQKIKESNLFENLAFPDYNFKTKSLLLKSKYNYKIKNEEGLDLEKFKSKEFSSKINIFIFFLNEFFSIEDFYSKNLFNLGAPKFFSYGKENIVFSKETESNEIFFLHNFSEEEQIPLEKLLIDPGKTARIKLPLWKIIKTAYNKLGTVHKECSIFLKDGVNNIVQVLQAEYNENYSEIKKEKKKLKQEIYDAKLNLNRCSEIYKTQEVLTKSQFDNYASSQRKKENPSVIIKLEMQAKLSATQLGGLKSKVEDAKDRIKEIKNKVETFNIKIYEFKNHWERTRKVLFATTLRCMISAYEIAEFDTQKILQELLNYNLVNILNNLLETRFKK